MIWVVAGLMVAGLLVLLYILRPRYERFRLSSARFFPVRSDNERARLELRIEGTSFSRAFLLQLLALACVVLAFLSQVDFQRPTDQALSIWLVIDTSASMTTLQNGAPRMALVADEVHALLDHLRTLQQEVRVCFNLSTLDQGLQTQAINLRPDQVEGFIQTLAARPLTSDLSKLRGLLTQIAGGQVDAECPATHLFVITDLPAPQWVAEQTDVPIVWRDIGQPVDNTAIIAVERSGGGLLGWNGGIDVAVANFGNTPTGRTLTITDAANSVIAQQAITQSSAQITAMLPQAGTYTVALNGTDAYSLDNQVTLNVNAIQQLHVDWRLPDRSMMDTMQWIQDEQMPDIHVIAPGEQVTNVPTLIVGSEYGRSASATHVQYFDEASPLLDDLNLDVADSLKIAGVQFGADIPVRYVLIDDEGSSADGQGGIWAATSETPRFVYIPGLPEAGGDENLNNFSSTLFFNAVRWLLKDRTLPVLYQPSASSLIDRSESNSALAPLSLGALQDMQPLMEQTHASPAWILLLIAAALLIAAGHAAALFGGSKWR